MNAIRKLIRWLRYHLRDKRTFELFDQMYAIEKQHNPNITRKEFAEKVLMKPLRGEQ
jgi:hypothetical protein